MVAKRFTAASALAALALAAAAGPAALSGAADLEKARPKPPPNDATYRGKTAERQKLMLHVTGRSVQIVAFKFDCAGKAIGATSLESIRIRKSTKGTYSFNAATYGIVSFSDEAPDENARVSIRGRFSTTANSIVGSLRVRSGRCGDTGAIEWRATRRSD